MELTKEQLQRVEKYLDSKNVYYIDIRVEVLDHIISEIENKMLHETDFEKAFRDSITKWNFILEDTSSLFLGYLYVKPKIIISKMKKMVKRHTIISYITMIIFLLIRYRITLNISTYFIETINKWSLILIYSFFILIVLGYIHIRITKQKTTYRFLYENKVTPIILTPVIISNSFVTENNELDSFKIMFFIISFFVMYLGIKLYKQHFLAVKKYSYHIIDQ